MVASIGSSAGLAVGDGVTRHRLAAGPGRHRHRRHRQRAGPAGPAGRRRHRHQRGDRRDPDRRGDQPRQLRRPARRLHRRGGRASTPPSAASATGEGGSIGLGFAIPIDDARGHRRGADPQRRRSSTPRSGSTPARSATAPPTARRCRTCSRAGRRRRPGILEGDVIVRVGDRPIAGADELVVAVRERNPGDTVPVEHRPRGPAADAHAWSSCAAGLTARRLDAGVRQRRLGRDPRADRGRAVHPRPGAAAVGGGVGGQADPPGQEYATGAREQLRGELGPEFDELRKPLEELRGLRELQPAHRRAAHPVRRRPARRSPTATHRRRT